MDAHVYARNIQLVKMFFTLQTRSMYILCLLFISHSMLILYRSAKFSALLHPFLPLQSKHFVLLPFFTLVFISDKLFGKLSKIKFKRTTYQKTQKNNESRRNFAVSDLPSCKNTIKHNIKNHYFDELKKK